VIFFLKNHAIFSNFNKKYPENATSIFLLYIQTSELLLVIQAGYLHETVALKPETL